RIHLQGISWSAGALWADPREDSAALSRGEWDHGAVEPNRAGSFGGSGAGQPIRSRGGAGPYHRLVQPHAFAQQLGLPAAERLLPRRPSDAARESAEENSGRPPSTP